MIELWFFFYVILPVMALLLGGGSIVYFPARLEWNDTFKRAALIARANLGSGEAKQKLVRENKALNPYIGDPDDEKAMAVWEAQFEGKELVLADKYRHEVVNSWSELNENYMEGTQERWFWECSCGEKDHRKTPEAAKMSARRHIKLYDGRNEEGVKDQGWLKRV